MMQIKAYIDKLTYFFNKRTSLTGIKTERKHEQIDI